METLKMESVLPDTIPDSMLPPVLKEYDTYTHTLKNQLEFYKQEHLSLRAEVTSLLEENKQLATQLKTSLSSNLARETIGEPRHHTADMVANLQRQVLLASQEKAAAMELYQTAVREVETLEIEVDAYRNDRHLDAAARSMEEVKKEYSTAITLLEEKIEALKAELSLERSRREAAENEMGLIRAERDHLSISLQEREKQLECLLEGQSSTLSRLEGSNCKVKVLTEEADALRQQRDELEAALTQATKKVEDFNQREWAALARVEEALTLVDAAVLEKDAALVGEVHARDEIARLQKSVEQLLEDAGKRVADEGSRLKQQYNAQMEVVLRDMRSLQEELVRKSGQLDKTSADLTRLEEELHRERKERLSYPDPEQMQRNVDNAYRELRRVEQEVCEVTRDRDRLLVRLQQLDDSHRAELSNTMEELRQVRLELQAARSQAEQTQVAAQTRTVLMEDQVTKLEQQLAALQASSFFMLPGDQVHAQCEAQFEEYRQMISQLNELQKQGVRVAQELQSHLDAQVEAKKKWQNEVKKLTAKFEQRIDSLNGQLGGLKIVNRQLENELAASRMFVPAPGEVDPQLASGPGPP